MDLFGKTSYRNCRSSYITKPLAIGILLDPGKNAARGGQGDPEPSPAFTL